MQQVQGRACQAGQPALHGIEHLEVGDEHTGDCGQVGCAPVAMDIAFPGADRAVTGDQAPGGLVNDFDLGVQSTAGFTEGPLTIVADHP
ncbi:hypothetical protein D3C73_1475800 [compost metagenome]